MVNMSRIELYPGGCQHKINMFVVPVPPELEHPFQVKLTDDLMCRDHSIHISLEAQVSVYAFLIEFDLYE